MLPAATYDQAAHYTFRQVLEQISSVNLPSAQESHRHEALSKLDQLPVTRQEETGRFILDNLDKLSEEVSEEFSWSARRIVSSEQLQYGFVICSESYSTEVLERFEYWVQLQQYKLLLAAKKESAETVAVLLAPRKGKRDRIETTVMIFAENVTFSQKELSTLHQMFPKSI